MKRIATFSTLIVLATASGALADSTRTTTFGNGASVSSERDCVRIEGQAAECNKTTTATNQYGESATASRNRVTSSDGTTVTRQGYGGVSSTTTRTVNR